MRALRRNLVLAVGLLALTAGARLDAGTATPSATSKAVSADEAAIRAAGESRDAAFKALNADALAAHYGDDAVLMPETAKTAKGHAAILGYLKVYLGLLVQYGYKPIVGKAVEIEVWGNTGLRSGTYSVTDKTGAVTDTGKWLQVWRKTGDKWHIIRDMWNSDMLPLFPPAMFTEPQKDTRVAGPAEGISMTTREKVGVLLACLLTVASCGGGSDKSLAPPAAAPAAPAAPSAAEPAARPETSFAADFAAIRAAGESRDAAYSALNADAFAALYGDDAVMMPEAAKTVSGHAAILGYLRVYTRLLAENGFKPAISKDVEIEVSGDLGLRSGTYSIKDPSGAVADTGKWLQVWRKTGGEWHIVRDIWNSDSLPIMPDLEPPGEG